MDLASDREESDRPMINAKKSRHKRFREKACITLDVQCLRIRGLVKIIAGYAVRSPLAEMLRASDNADMEMVTWIAETFGISKHHDDECKQTIDEAIEKALNCNKTHHLSQLVDYFKYTRKELASLLDYALEEALLDNRRELTHWLIKKLRPPRKEVAELVQYYTSHSFYSSEKLKKGYAREHLQSVREWLRTEMLPKYAM